ncbi:MAG: beta-propeller domain-containing protein [Deltaproteobacteria bacterium]|nr:beta-propeller domain-containing protein [Deltaproteobacteria bacterium]
MNASFLPQGWSVWRAVAAFLVAAAVIAGCSPSAGVGTGGTGSYSAKLVKATDCGDLERRLKTELRRRYERQDSYFIYYGWMNIIYPPLPPTTTTATASGSVDAAPSHSETNVQEKGVDEGDLVKTDGTYIYLARGSRFIVMKAQPAAETAIVSDIDLKEPIGELYLNGSQVSITTSTYNRPSPAVPLVANLTLPWSPITRVYLYDVTNAAMPTVTARYDLPGAMQGSRRINSTIYMVTNYAIDIPNPVNLWNYMYPGDHIDQDALIAANALAKAENLKRIDAATLGDLLPSYSRTLYSGGVAGTPQKLPAVDCTDVSIPESGNGTDLSLVIAIDTSSPEPVVTSSGVLSSWCTLYMSPDSLYLASTNNWLWITPMADAGQPPANPEPATALHKFSVAQTAGKPLYRGSGTVNGWLNNQFSMGEYNGYLRIGTTRGGWFGEGISNQLAILGEKEGALVETGRIGGLAPGERIYSMRFDRSRGYMVTFRQTDPLYTLDLSDPAKPRVAGEIKVNGFATYIHLVGPDNSRLLTIGQSANASGVVTGNKLQLFDVSNLSTPRLIGDFELGSGWSSALYDYHAFLYYDLLGVLAIPYETYSPTLYSSGLRVFTVGDTAITQRGLIQTKNINGDAINGYLVIGGSISDTVYRSVIIGNSIYAIAYNSIAVADIDTLAVEKVVNLP